MSRVLVTWRVRGLLLESLPSTCAARVSCHGITTGDDGCTTTVTLKEITSPCLVQLTIACKSLSISSRTASSTSHILSSVEVHRSLASFVKLHSKPAPQRRPFDVYVRRKGELRPDRSSVLRLARQTSTECVPRSSSAGETLHG